MPSFRRTPCALTRLRRVVWLVCACALFVLASAERPLAQSGAPILVSEPDSTRAIALESVTFMPEPFPLASAIQWGPDDRTRVTVLALNLSLRPGEDLSAVTADAEDADHRVYELKVEHVGPVPGQEWLTEVVLRLNDEMGDVGDVLVRVSYRGQASNRVRMAVGHMGGGPPDDEGSAPTLAPPYFITGRVTSARGEGIAGMAVVLGGASQSETVTDRDGFYTLIATTAGDHHVSAVRQFYEFDPPARVFAPLSNHQSGVDFVATRQTYGVHGLVTDEDGSGLLNVAVRLSVGGVAQPLTTITDDAGLFSFPEVPAGFNYTVTPVNNNVFTFAPQSTGQLLDNAVMSFTGARRSWSVSGVVRRNGSAVAGVTVELEGTGRKATTDSAGRYVINGVPAGLTYKVLPSSEDYAYDPGSLTIDSLQGDTVADFNVTHFLLHGRVTDPEGRGVFGVTVNLTGTLTATTFTRDDGTYSIPVHRTGNYTITPTKEQNFYAFAPEKARLTGLDGSRRGDFTATLNTSASPSYVLEYDGGQKTVDYGPFWPESIDLGHFFWEFWAMPGPGAGATYMLTDGYGGAHALLFGVSHLGTSEPGRYQFIGNIWDGQAVNFFYSDEGPAPNEWGHFAVGWDGAHIVTYFNGVPVGAVRHRGTRFTPGFAQGGGRLLIGGSDHNNFVGRIAQVRGYEGSNPRGAGGEPGETSVFSTFAPQTIFSVDGNLLSYFFKTAPVVGDYSKGFEGSPHPGVRRGTVNGILFPCDGCPKPAFVVDKTAPNFATPDNPGQPAAPVRPAAPTPAGAMVFDSFQRSNSTLALGGTGGLGSTESGTAGPLAWKFDTNETPLPFGILNGRAVLLADRSSVAWVEPGAQPVGLDVSAARTRGTYGSGQNTGLSFRVADADNYFFAFTENDGDDLTGPKLLTVGYYLDGERTELTSEVEIPGNWRTLRVLTYNDGRIHVLADGLLIYSTTSGLLSSASGAGLYNDRAGMALTNRWDEFTVFKLN